MLINARKILDAFEFIKIKHADQIRRGSGDLYVTHPVAVSYLVAAYKRSKHMVDIIVASLLHDTLEDTDATFEEIEARFGLMVAEIVLELKNDESEITQIGKLAYHKLKLLDLSSYALTIKLCDRLHNISEQPTKKMVMDTIELMNFVRDNRKLTASQNELVDDVLELCISKSNKQYDPKSCTWGNCI